MTHLFRSMYVSLSSLLLSSIFFFFISAAASSENGGDGFTVDLLHRDSPHSPSYDPSATRFERLRTSFHRSFSRQVAFTSAAAAAAAISPDSFHAPLTHIASGGEYLMKIKIGTPPQEQLAVADTGSDPTWTQCKPCNKCYNQTLPLFDTQKSSSYRTVQCQANTCRTSGVSLPCVSGGRCLYTVGYGDKSHTTGEVATETLTFDSGVSFPNVAFGCGHDNAVSFSGTGASGIVGLGGGPFSIVNQLRSATGGRFSYCLASESNISSRISFGRDAIVKGRNAVATPLAAKSPPTLYFLTLQGMSVGSARLDFASSPAANANGVADGNIIIDSGTTLTFIPTDLYNRVEAKVVGAVAKARVADPHGLFKLCYRVESGLRLPTITAHFRGADVVLPKGSTFVEVEKGTVCLALMPSTTFSIFGNLHQINYQVGYDLVKREVRFLPTDCSKRR